MTNPALETIAKPFALHVLVCTNTRNIVGKASCGPMGAEEIRAELKTWMHDELKRRPKLTNSIRVRVNGSGCLDFCKRGVVIAVYPQSEFMFFAKNTAESMAAVKAQLMAKLDELER